MNDRPRINWTVIKTFEEGNILVELSASDGHRPMYNARVGRRGEKGTIPFLPMFVEGQGRVSVRPVAEIVARLLNQAEEHVSELAQAREDAFFEQRIERETRAVEREGKKRRPSGYKQRGP